jgi:hypothetical protein
VIFPALNFCRASVSSFFAVSGRAAVFCCCASRVPEGSAASAAPAEQTTALARLVETMNAISLRKFASSFKVRMWFPGNECGVLRAVDQDILLPRFDF